MNFVLITICFYKKETIAFLFFFPFLLSICEDLPDVMSFLIFLMGYCTLLSLSTRDGYYCTGTDLILNLTKDRLAI